jgi:hypothetical protein
MNWEAIGSLGEIIGAAAVVTSLIYVGVQFRQYKTEAQASSRDSMSRATVDMLLRIATNDTLFNVYLKGMNDPSKLGPGETYRFDMIFYAIFETWETTFSQWKRGMLTPQDWKKWEVIIRYYLTAPGVKEFWKRHFVQFSDEFQEYIDNLEPDLNYDFSRRSAQKDEDNDPM